MASFTTSQQASIEAQGNTLVMAGAGTGKTRTLVERCLRGLLADPPDYGLDAILVVTFTESAAREMRERIRRRLEEAFAARPGAGWLAAQIALIDTAAIGTLHSFCGQLVREHFHELGLDPQAAILDEAQATVLRANVLDDLLERRFADSSPAGQAFRNMVLELAQGRTETVVELVQALHTFARSLPFPEVWLEQLRASWTAPTPDGSSVGADALDRSGVPPLPRWPEIAREGLARWAAFWRDALAEAVPMYPSLRSLSESLTGLRADTAPAEQVARLAAILAIRDAWPGKEKEAKKVVVDLFREAGEFHQLLAADATGDPLAQDWCLIRPHMLALVDLTQAFTVAYADARREAGGLDFNDLEHLALRLLRGPGTGAPTPRARQMQDRYRMVLVDEYQDINAVQDALLEAIGRTEPPGNRFLVGDLKQSIYRFRRTDPTIFRRYAADWSGTDRAGITYHLQENFRSHPGLLDFVNDLFGALLRSEVGGVQFDESSRLIPGEADRAWGTPEPPVEFLLAVEGGEDEAAPDESETAALGGDDTRLEQEAARVARRLRELRDSQFELPLRDGQRRPVTWADMVVLLRSPASRAETYAKVFEQLGVPLAVARRGLYQSLEVQDLLNLLALLDNPLQDIPALAVFRSPLAGLTIDELAALRVEQRSGSVWTAAQRFHETGSDEAGPHDDPASNREPTDAAAQMAVIRRSAWRKLDRFFARYREWRNWVRRAALSECLEAILTQTHYEDWLNLQPRARQRRANVRQLVALARQFDQFQRHSLHRFLRFVEAQKETEFDPEPPAVEGADAVQLMSIHKSKGLEFPVVVVADLGKRFNEMDLRGPVLIDEAYGLCPRIQPPGARSSYPSLPLLFAREHRRAELLGEELRLLYVACTRAETKLILVGSASDTARRPLADRWADAPAGPWPAHRLLQARSVLDWIGPWFQHRLSGTNWLRGGAGQNEGMAWRVERPPQSIESTPEPSGTGPQELPSWERLGAAYRRLAVPYPHGEATFEPAKSSVTALRQRTVAADPTEDAHAWFRESAPAAFPALRLEPDGRLLSPTERGTAHHRFLQLADLERLATDDDVRTQAQALVASGRLSSEEAETLDASALSAFGRSELAARLRAAGQAVRREFEFTLRLTPDDAHGLGLPVRAHLAPDEMIIVQGVVDVAVLASDGIWLVDFKTDRVDEASFEAKVRDYTPQLALYALALSRIHRRPAREAWLHFLTLNRSVAVPLPGFLTLPQASTDTRP